MKTKNIFQKYLVCNKLENMKNVLEIHSIIYIIVKVYLE